MLSRVVDTSATQSVVARASLRHAKRGIVRRYGELLASRWHAQPLSKKVAISVIEVSRSRQVVAVLNT